MSYTIVKSDGSSLTTIADGTISTNSTSLGLPGRNFAGYGLSLNTNFVHVVENFASTAPPANPLRGQLWYDISDSLLKVCPADGQSNAAAWQTLTSTVSGGTTTFGEVDVTGDVLSNNVSVTNEITSNSMTSSFLTVSSDANIGNATITTASIGAITSTEITTGSQSTTGTLTGAWTVDGDDGGTALSVNGNLEVIGANLVIKVNDANSFVDANGDPITFTGTYSNANVEGLLPVYGGDLAGARLTTPILTTGANTTPGTVTGNWTLTSGSRLQASYADLAERFAADKEYTPGTLVQIGGDYEITEVDADLSDKVFGVVSNTAAYLMNADSGSDSTHPAIALAGRVLVRAVGHIQKGQRLVSAGDGLARAGTFHEVTAFNTFGRALQDKTTPDEGLVEAVVTIR